MSIAGRVLLAKRVESINDERARITTEREKALAGLRRDGQPIYAPAEEQRRREEIEQKYQSALRTVKESIAQTIKEAEAELAASGATDPLARLTDDEMARAANRREFIREDWELLGLETLVHRIRRALESRDRAEMALHQRYGQTALNERFRMDQRGPSMLKPLLADLEGKLIDVKLRDRARETIDELRRMELSMATEGYLERRRSRV